MRTVEIVRESLAFIASLSRSVKACRSIGTFVDPSKTEA
jgi:hypothetical protein